MNYNSSNIIDSLLKIDWSFPNESGGTGLYGLHPYPAKFIPQIPRDLIKNVGVAKNGVVFDPFCGSGTTLLEAQSLGYSSVGVDLNPIACLISKVATSQQPKELKVSVNRCIKFAETIKTHQVPDIPNLDHWFKKPIQKAIAAILNAIENEISEPTRDILHLALSSTIVRVSNQDSDTRYAAVEKNVTAADVLDLFSKACSRYMSSLPATDYSLPECQVYCRNVLEIDKNLISKPVGLVICSPPYPNAYEYWLYHKYRMWWLGYDPQHVKENEIGARPHYFKKNPQTPEDFRNQMSQVFSLLKNICIDNSYACFVLGDSKIHGKIIDNTELLKNSAEENNFETTVVLNRNIALSRKAFNLSNSRLKTENVIVFRKKYLRSKSSSTSAILYWHPYRYLPYEKQFALRELAAIPKVQKVSHAQDIVSIVLAESSVKELSNLVYFSAYESSVGEKHKTLQAKLENGTSLANGTQKRQATRYSVHGLHEYKGKFNPQIVRSILNMYKTRPSSIILDPFCGSGTTLIESTIAGVQSVGWDMNPFAVYLSNAKISALHSVPGKLYKLSDKIINAYNNGNYEIVSRNRASEEYLKKWFPKETYTIIESFRSIILKEGGELANLFLVILSDLLRDYSLQEPTDLRIRRRKSAWPTISLPDKITKEFLKKIKIIEAGFNAHGPLSTLAKAVVADGRNLNSVKKAGLIKSSCDFALTSPPYATALPYIDTQRLSLIWLDLLIPETLRHAEETLIGSREAKKAVLDSLSVEMSLNTAVLPIEHIEYCRNLATHVGEADGFRRRAVPVLLYRYFSDMFKTFDTVRSIVKKDGFYCLIVGTNKTTLGGTQFIIDTPRLLGGLAENSGWSIQELLPLETYKRYGLHSANSVQEETLLVLKNE